MGVLLALRFCVRLESQRGEVSRNLESREVGILYTRLRPGTVLKKTRKVASFSSASHGIAKGMGTGRNDHLLL